VSLGELASGNVASDKLGKSIHAPVLWKEGKIEELVAYCKQDVVLLVKIFERGDYIRFASKEKQASKGEFSCNYGNQIQRTKWHMKEK
jgi:hypothetical protein